MVTFIYDANLASVGHDHVVAILLEQAADPRRMCPRLQGNATRRHLLELLREAAFGSANRTLGKDIPRGIQRAVRTVLVAQVDAYR